MPENVDMSLLVMDIIVTNLVQMYFNSIETTINIMYCVWLSPVYR